MYLFLSLAYLYNYWSSQQEMFMRWGSSCSTKFCVTYGVKQGGILSPALFNVYVSNLNLNHSDIDGSLGWNLIKHLCDDIR